MAPRKKVESTAVAAPAATPLEGELIPPYDLGKSLGVVITSASTMTNLVEGYKAFPSDEKLSTYLATIKGNAAAKAFLKECSSTRTAIERAHKEAKAPWLDAARKLDAKLKELKEEVLGYETPIKTALAAEENKAAEQERKATEARMAELEAEVAKLRTQAEAANLMPELVAKEIVVTIRGREASQAARTIFTTDIYDEVKTDEAGTPYILEVVLRRKAVQDD